MPCTARAEPAPAVRVSRTVQQEEPAMSSARKPQDPIGVARLMIRRHGLRAGAVAAARASEAQLGGAPAELDRWRAVQTAISELRRTAPDRAAAAAQ
jgi:hypothetical protein